TTRIEVQVPESVLSVTPTRNALYDVETTVAQLDEPVTDAHGNEVTERTAAVTYTARTPLPDGQRDTFELSFQVPDAAGESLAFPTIQTCEQGRTAWVEVPEDGQDAEELEHPAPSFEITPASADGHGAATSSEAGTAEPETQEAASSDGGSDAVGWAGLALGALGLLAGGTALARSRVSA
ncbi:MAG TPA: YcnI family protein, partial [Nocardioides sp.]|nr:YcnI family protein [Nocardioides sp.]